MTAKPEQLKRDAAWLLTRERIADRMNIVTSICETCLNDLDMFDRGIAKNELHHITTYATDVRKILIPRYAAASHEIPEV